MAFLDPSSDPLAPPKPSGDSPSARMLRGFEGYSETPYWDVNHLRAGYGSDTVTTPEGGVREMRPGVHVSRKDAERDLHRRVLEAQVGVADHIGLDTWQSLSPGAQAALTSLAYNYGSLDKLPTIIAAAQSGSPEALAVAIANRRGDNGGVNAHRRMQEAEAVLADSGQIASDAGPAKPVSWSAADFRKSQGGAPAPSASATGGEASTSAPSWSAAAFKAHSAEQEKTAKAKTEEPWYQRYLDIYKAVTTDRSPEEKKADEARVNARVKAAMDDPNTQAEVRRVLGESEFQQMLGLGSGAVQFGTKLAGLLPNELGGKQAVEATKKLEALGAKPAQEVGELGAAFALPVGRLLGVAGKGAEALSGAGKLAAEEAPAAVEAATKAPAAISRLKQAAEGVKTGAKTGALYGTAESGGTEEDYGRRLEEKGLGGVLGGVTGAGLGMLPVGFGALGDLASATKRAYGSWASGAGEEGARRFVPAVQKIIGEAAESKGEEAARSSALADVKKGFAENGQRELDRLAALRQALGDRRRATGVERPTEFRAADEMASEIQRMRAHAETNGLTPQESEQLVLAEQRKVAAEELAAEAFTHDLQARPNAEPKEVGDKIQQAAKQIYDEGVALRRRESGIDKIISAAGRQENYSADTLTDYIKSEAEHVSNASEQAMFRHFESVARGAKPEAEEIVEEHLPGEKPSERAARVEKAQQAAKEQAEAPGKMSLNKLESLRKDIGSALQTKQLALANGNTLSITPEAAHHLGKMKAAIDADIAKQAPELSAALEKFAEMSRPLDEFRASLKDVIATDVYRDEFKMGEAAVVDKILARAGQGLEPIKFLVQNRPELRDDLTRLYNRKLFGFKDAPKEPSIEEFGRFLERNGEALRQAGLYEDFADLKRAKAAGDAAVERARARYTAQEQVHEERLGAQTTAVKEAKGAAEKEAGAAEQQAAKAEKLKENFTTSLDQISAHLDKKTPDLKAAVNASENMLTKLLDEGFITREQYRDFLKQVHDVKTEFKEAEEAKAHIRQLGNIVAATAVATGLSTLGLSHLRSLQLVPHL